MMLPDAAFSHAVDPSWFFHCPVSSVGPMSDITPCEILWLANPENVDAVHKLSNNPNAMIANIDSFSLVVGNSE